MKKNHVKKIINNVKKQTTKELDFNKTKKQVLFFKKNENIKKTFYF